MKHTLKITAYLLLIFFLAQVAGLAIINQYIDHQKSIENKKAEFKQLPLSIERPDVQENVSWLYIIIAVVIGTIIILLIIKFNQPIIWKLWFLFAVVLCLTVAFGAFMPALVAFFVALALSIIKIFKPNIYIHNLTEMFIYGGLAAIFVPIINISSAIILLVAISLYDMYAVWKSKHMVGMAKFQSKSNIFAGLLIPYNPKAEKGAKKKFVLKFKAAKKVKLKKTEVKNAVLGGGDIGFPLIFSGVVMKNLMLVDPVIVGMLKTLIISACVTISLGILLFKAKQDKFYPAMPFLSAGCLAGYGIVLLVNML